MLGNVAAGKISAIVTEQNLCNVRENLVKIYTKCEEYAINQVCSKGCPAYGENIDEITTENFNIFREIRFMSITNSGSSRSVIPAHVDHRFRFMSISDSGSSRSPK
jgi:hypothetical protein